MKFGTGVLITYSLRGTETLTMVVAHQVRQFSAFYGARRYINGLPLESVVSQLNPVHTLFFKYILISCQCLHGIFLQVFLMQFF
jgi:hypothetical protein